MKFFSKTELDPFAEILQCIRKGDYERALGWFQQLLERDPKNTRIRLRYADAVALTGRDDEAVRQYRMVADELAQAGFKIQALALNKKIVQLDPSQAIVDRAPAPVGPSSTPTPTETTPRKAPPRDATLLNRTVSTSENSIDSSNGSMPSPEPRDLKWRNWLGRLAGPGGMKQPRTGSRTHEASEADAQAATKLDVAHDSDSGSDALSNAPVQMSQTEIHAGELSVEKESTKAATGEAEPELEVKASSRETAPPESIEIESWAAAVAVPPPADEPSTSAGEETAGGGEVELDIMVETVPGVAECDADAFAWFQEEIDLTAPSSNDSDNLVGEPAPLAADDPIGAQLFSALNA